MKKTLVFVLAILMLLALAACGAKEIPNAETMADYASVGESYREAVKYVVAEGVMKADENNNFLPQENLTVAEAENIVSILMGQKPASKAIGETVSSNDFGLMVMRATNCMDDALAGELIGYNASFTTDPVTKEHAAQILSNYLTFKGAKETNMQKTELSFAHGNGVRLLGRAEATENGVMTNFPCDGVEFTLECAGPMDVAFVVEGTGQYRAEVDGILVDFKEDAADLVRLAHMIPAGKHTIRILQENDIPTPGTCNTIRGISMLCKPETLVPTEEKPLYIEFLGGSSAAGMGAIGDNTTKWNRQAHSGTHSYSYMTAKKLGADLSVVAKGGIGILGTTHVSQGTYVASELYAAQNVYRDENRPATHGKADVVIVGVGGNDKEEKPDTRFENTFRELMKQVRQANPDAEIVIIFNWMNSRHGFFYRSLPEELGGREAGYHVIMMERLTNGVRSGSATNTPHPSAADNERHSDKIVEYLKTIPSVQAKLK